MSPAVSQSAACSLGDAPLTDPSFDFDGPYMVAQPCPDDGYDPIVYAVCADLQSLSISGHLDYSQSPRSKTTLGMNRQQILRAHYHAALEEACYLQAQLAGAVG